MQAAALNNAAEAANAVGDEPLYRLHRVLIAPHIQCRQPVRMRLGVLGQLTQRMAKIQVRSRLRVEAFNRREGRARMMELQHPLEV